MSGWMDRTLVALLALLLGATALMASRPAWWPGMVAAASGAGVLLVTCWQRDALTTWHVVVGAVLLRLVFVGLPPVLSDDGFRYVWDGMVQVEEGISPYRYVPEAEALRSLRDEPVYERLNSASYYSVYPPASQGVFLLGGLFYDMGWPVSFYVINVLFALMEGACVFALARLVPARTLLLYAWHPLVLLEAAGQGHSEAGAALLLVVTVICVRRARPRWAAAALAGAALFKLYPVVLFPLLWRRSGWRALWPAGLVGGLFCLPYATPEAVRNAWTSLDLYVRLFEFNAGPYYALKQLLYGFTGADWSKTLGPALRWIFLMALPVIYVLDARRRWPLAKAFLMVLGVFFVCSTTVHPWYLLPVLAVVALRGRPAWHWQWLAVGSLGTYLLYTSLPASDTLYWTFVAVGWGGWALLIVWTRRDKMLQLAQRWRARNKLRRIRPYFPEEAFYEENPLHVLDLGAGEGYVGRTIGEQLDAEVVLADVADLNRTDLRHVSYDGRRLPFSDDAFDVVVLYFVLHHAADPRAALGEALRAARRRVIVVESVFEGERQRQLLRILDRAINRLRFRGEMEEGTLRFKTAEAWRGLIEEQGGMIVQERRRGRWVHRQAMFSVRPP